MIQKPTIYVFSNAYSDGTSSAATGGKPNQRLEALDATINLNIDGVSSSASIRLAAGSKVDTRCYVEMFTVLGSAGMFRTRSPQIGYGGQGTTIQLEHAINEMGDFIINDKFEAEYTLAQAMKKIFSYYNEKGMMWKLRTVDDPIEDVDEGEKAETPKCVLDVDHDNCLEAIESVMEQYPGMMLSFNFKTLPWELSVVNKPFGAEAEGRLSRNVKSAVVTRDDSELFTRVYMDGYQNSGNKYGSVTSKYWSGKYGVIETTITGANDTKAVAHRTMKNYIKTHKKPRYSISIDGIELSSITGEKMDKFVIGKMFRLALPDYGTTVSEHITALSFPSVYGSPNSVTVTLNSDPDRVIKYIKKAQKTASKAAKSAVAVQRAAIVDATVANNILTLTKGDGTKVSFSKAVTLKGSWSGGTFTVRAYQKNTNSTTGKVEEINVVNASTKLNGIVLQANKSPTVSGTYDLKIPLKVMYDNGLPASQGNKSNTEYAEDVVISGKVLYDKGWLGAYKKVKLPKTTPASFTNTILIKTPASSNSGSGEVSTSYIIENDGNNAVVLTTKVGSDYIPVARLSHGKYNSGWSAAYGKVSLPTTEKTSSNSITVKTPASTVGDTDTRSYYMGNTSGDNNKVDLFTTGDITVARFSHGKYNSGWTAAYGKVSIPTTSKTSSNTITVKTPSSTVGSQDTASYYMGNTSGDNNKVDLFTSVDGDEITVARFSHGKYNSGWAAAYGKVSVPTTAKTSSNTITVKAPASTVGSQDTFSYYIGNTSGDDNKVDLFTSVSGSEITVARFSHNKYNAGWDNAEGLVSVPSSSSTSGTYTIKYPLKSTSGGTTTRSQSTTTYTLSNDGSYAYLKIGSTTVARVSQYYNKSGTIYYDSYEYSGGNFVYHYHQTVSQQSQAILSSGNRTVRWHA